MNDDFEKRLRQLPPREVPSAWREQILATAQSAEIFHHPSPAARHNILSILIQQLSSLAHPQRLAWAGLATAWVVIITLHLATGETSKIISATTPTTPATPETVQAIKQQRLLYAELVGRPEWSPLNRPKINIPGPRSQRREETIVG